MATALSLIGITSLLAGGVVEGALRYANVIPYRLVASFIVVPGLYSVSTRLLKRCNNRLARIFSPGDREDRKKILGFESSCNYKYVGMRSGTDAFVVNALFESWMNIANKDPDETRKNSVMIRNGQHMGSKSTLGMTKCKLVSNSNTMSLISVSKPWYLAASIVLELGAIAVFVLMVITKDVAGITINAANMVVYFLINFFVTRDRFYVPIPEPAKNVPPGDIAVTNKSNNNIWVVRGSERDIQSIAQKEIQTGGQAPEIVETIVYIAGLLVAIATILVVPIMSKTAQTYIAIQLGMGLLSSIVFSSRDGELMLKKLLEKHYNMTDTQVTKFTNRATVVAAAAFSTSADVKHIHSSMVPETHHYDNYRKLLQKVIDDMSVEETKLHKLAEKWRRTNLVCDNKLEVVKLFKETSQEASNMLCDNLLNSDNMNTWPKRLLTDIVEAFVEVYVVNRTSYAPNRTQSNNVG